jgi:hypothetical protein
MKKVAVSGLVFAIFLLGCPRNVDPLTRTVQTIQAVDVALKHVAKMGAQAHGLVLKGIIAEAGEARESLGCGSGSSLPPECDVDAWRTARAELMRKWNAEVERYRLFEAAVLSTYDALRLAAEGVMAYEDNREGIDLLSLLGTVLRSYSAVADLLSQWGVDAPEVGL